jgi:hypothetical protein
LKTFATHLAVVEGGLELTPNEDYEPKLALALSIAAVRLEQLKLPFNQLFVSERFVSERWNEVGVAVEQYNKNVDDVVRKQHEKLLLRNKSTKKVVGVQGGGD